MILYLVTHHIDASLGANDIVFNFTFAVWPMPATRKGFHAVWPCIDYIKVVKNIAILGIGTNLTTTGTADSFWCLIVHRPHHLVEAVDVLFDIEVTRQPCIVVPVTNLIFHFAVAFVPRASRIPDATCQVTALHRDNLTDRPVFNLRKRSQFARVISPAQSRHERQSFRFGHLRRLHHRPHTRRIDSDWFFAKDMLPGFDGRTQMLRAKMRRGGQQDYVRFFDHAQIVVEA